MYATLHPFRLTIINRGGKPQKKSIDPVIGAHDGVVGWLDRRHVSSLSEPVSAVCLLTGTVKGRSFLFACVG